MKTEYLKKTFARRVFTFLCFKDPAYWGDEADDEPIEVEFYYCSEYGKQRSPVNYQSRWIHESRGFVIPNEVQDSVYNLSQLAEQNKTNFIDLALTAQSGKKSTKVKPTVIYDSRINTEQLAEELNLLSKLIIREGDLDSLNARRVLIGGLANLLVDKSYNKILANLFSQLTDEKPEIACDRLTFNSAVQLDCYGNLYHRHLILLIHDNINLGLKTFKITQKIIIRSLKKFSKAKLDSSKFEILNVKQMQKNLAALLAK